MLSAGASDSVLKLEKELTSVHDSTKMIPLFVSLSKVWEHSKQLPLAAYYGAKVAKLENSEKKLTFAGQFYLQLMENESSASLQAWEAGEAVRCLEQSLKINPDGISL